jgi:uncharacterized protein (DUF1330 family)
VTVYVLAQLTIRDRERYDRYAGGFMPVLRQYGGRLHAAQDGPEVAEGEWNHDRVVIFSFPDRDTFVAWRDSPEYQAIVQDRYAGADATLLLIRGLD